MAVRQDRHRQCRAFFIVATLCILYARCIPDGDLGNAEAENVQTCVENKNILLEISAKTPAAKFTCDPALAHLLPTVPDNSAGNGCFTEVGCKNKGTLPAGVGITFDKQKKIYTVQTTEIPTANSEAYFLCTDTAGQESAKQVVPKKCTVELKIKGSPAISEERQCTKADQTVNIRLTTPTNEATFVCGGTLTTLAPADSTVFSDESCTKETQLDTLLPGATLTPGTGLEEQRHTLSISTFPEKTTTLCYKCQDSGATNVCKVIITVDGTTATSTTTASTSGAASVVAEAGGHAILWVAALSTTVLYGRYL